MEQDTHWIDVVSDLDMKLLGMSDEALDAFAYAAAQPLGPISSPPKHPPAVSRRPLPGLSCAA